MPFFALPQWPFTVPAGNDADFFGAFIPGPHDHAPVIGQCLTRARQQQGSSQKGTTDGADSSK